MTSAATILNSGGEFCCSIDERREVHCRINRMIESACRTNSNTTRSVPSRETDTERAIRSTRPAWTWPYTAQKGPSGGRFCCTPTLLLSLNGVVRQKSISSRGSGARDLSRQQMAATERQRAPLQARRRVLSQKSLLGPVGEPVRRRGAVSGYIQLVKGAGPMLFWSHYHQYYPST